MGTAKAKSSGLFPHTCGRRDPMAHPHTTTRSPTPQISPVLPVDVHGFCLVSTHQNKWGSELRPPPYFCTLKLSIRAERPNSRNHDEAVHGRRPTKLKRSPMTITGAGVQPVPLGPGVHLWAGKDRRTDSFAVHLWTRGNSPNQARTWGRRSRQIFPRMSAPPRLAGNSMGRVPVPVPVPAPIKALER